jgi:hypothetical protein
MRSHVDSCRAWPAPADTLPPGRSGLFREAQVAPLAAPDSEGFIFAGWDGDAPECQAAIRRYTSSPAVKT